MFHFLQKELKDNCFNYYFDLYGLEVVFSLVNVTAEQMSKKNYLITYFNLNILFRIALDNILDT